MCGRKLDAACLVLFVSSLTVLCVAKAASAQASFGGTLVILQDHDVMTHGPAALECVNAEDVTET